MERLLFSRESTMESADHYAFDDTQTTESLLEEVKLTNAQVKAFEADLAIDELAELTGTSAEETIEGIEYLLYADDVNVIDYSSSRAVIQAMSSMTARPVKLSDFTEESFETDKERLIEELQQTTEGFLGDIKAGIARVSKRIYRSTAAFTTVLLNHQSAIDKLARKLEKQMADTTEGNVIGATFKSPAISSWFTSPEDAVSKINTYAEFRKQYVGIQDRLKGIVTSESVDDFAKGIEDVLSPLAGIGGTSGGEVTSGVTTVTLPSQGGGVAVFTAGLVTAGALAGGGIYGVKNVKWMGKAYKKGSKKAKAYSKMALKKLKKNKYTKGTVRKVIKAKRARSRAALAGKLKRAPSAAAKAISSKFTGVMKSIKEGAQLRKLPGFKVGKTRRAMLMVKNSTAVKAVWSKAAYLKKGKAILAANIPGVIGFLILEAVVTKGISWAMAKRLPALEYAQIKDILNSVQSMGANKISLSGIAAATQEIEKAAGQINDTDPGALRRGRQSIASIMAFTSMVNKMGRTVYKNSVSITKAGVSYAAKSLKVHAKTTMTTEGATPESTEWLDTLDAIVLTLESTDFIEDAIAEELPENYGSDVYITEENDDEVLTSEARAEEFMFEDIDDLVELVDNEDEEFVEYAP